ncbi:hypothetical protein CAP35_11365 [Chitinophagaceae bacterium IBVUCB1]|nr:hypothetical protein CAP35_11365 [Chitinophagaceae bacterium IBVUCB1]
MNAETNKYLFDIQASIDTIISHLDGVTDLQHYKKDAKTIDAVERRLAIIGEALWKADKINNTLPITNKIKIIGLRHILVHDYDLIDDEAIWTICKKYLPVLKTEVMDILSKQ